MRDEDVDSILAKYKHLGQKEVSFDRKGEMEENVFAGDEDGEGFVLDENETDFSEDGKLVEKAEVKDIENIENALPGAFEIQHAFNVFVLGEDTLKNLGIEYKKNKLSNGINQIFFHDPNEAKIELNSV